MFVLESNVAGVSYEPFKSNLQTLLRYNGFDATYSVLLSHNPHNPHDPNAVEIYLKGSRHHACQMVGFIPRQFNTALLKIGLDKLDASLVAFNPYYMDIVGLRVCVKERLLTQYQNEPKDIWNKLTRIHRVIKL